MINQFRDFNRALKSHVGRQMFTSVPLLLIILSLVLLFQVLYFIFFEIDHIGIEPIVISFIVQTLFLPVSYILMRNPHFNQFALLNFILLLFFYALELYLQIFIGLAYLWPFLLIIQVLAGYYLLMNRYYYSFTVLNMLIYSLYVYRSLSLDLPVDSILVMAFSIIVSFLLHKDRKKSLFTLALSYESQKETNHRFRQLEENISQIFVLCSADFKTIYYISSTVQQILSLSIEDLKDNPNVWMEFIHQSDRMRVELEMESILQEKSEREFDFRYEGGGGTTWLHIQFFPVKSESGGVVDRFAIIIDNITEKKEAELKLVEARSLDGEMAARIQRNLLFSDYHIPLEGVDGAADSIPSLDVGGDYYDIYNFSPKISDIIIADVMGKGRIAALLGAASKSAFMKARLDLSVRNQSIPDIEDIVSYTSQSIGKELIKMGKFITLQYVRLNMETGFFEFVDKGHTSILYYSARLKSFWSLKGWNMPLGFNPDEKVVKNLMPMEQGDLYFLYSDGIIEAENEEGEQFGERRLTYLLKNSLNLTSNQIINKIKNMIFHYSSAQSYSDDITCISLKIDKMEKRGGESSLVLQGKRDSLQIFRTFATAFLREEFPSILSDSLDAIILAVNEAVANIIEHNYEKNPIHEDREVFLKAERIGAYCCFRLFWDGKEFDWTMVKAPDLKEMKGGGYGVSLIREIMDSVSYSSNLNEVQQLTMIKKILSVE